jgi:hypothetical protein
MHQPENNCLCPYLITNLGCCSCQQVSEVRLGKLLSYNIVDGMLELEPWPNPSIHPLKQMHASQAGKDMEDEDGEIKMESW